jgi:hypothetical protein
MELSGNSSAHSFGQQPKNNKMVWNCGLYVMPKLDLGTLFGFCKCAPLTKALAL